MKSVNVKRIAAAAAGAAMLGAAFAGAVAVDPGLAGFQFFSNGSPNVVLVVGSKAQPADAVAAANVGAMIGNLAYQSGAAVEVTGTDLLTCSGGSGAGSATLTVETPGVNPALAYEVKTYVSDYLDSSSDTVRNVTAAVPSVSNGTISGDPKLISQDHTQILVMPSSGKISNSKGLNVKQEQRVRLYAKTMYDEGDDRLEGQQTTVLYETTFSDPLPLCWDSTKTQALCPDKDLLTKSRTKISFLGDSWVIIPYSGKTWSLGADGIVGASLGKEVDYKSFMVSGDSTTLPDGKKVVLLDITGIGTGTSTQTRATFQIYAADGSLLDQTSLYPLESYDKNGVVIFLWDAVGGSIGGTDYSEVSLFANKLDLVDGQKISGQGYWKADLVSQAVSSTEGLQKIVLYNDNDIYNLAAGESVQLIKNIPGLKVTFNGLSLKDEDYDPLSFTLRKDYQLTIGAGVTISGDMIQISSTRTNAFQFESGAVNLDSIFVIVAPNFVNASNSTYNYGAGTIFYRDTSPDNYVNGSTANGTFVAGFNASGSGGSTYTSAVNYYPSASDTVQIRFSDNANFTTATRDILQDAYTASNDRFLITVSEPTEDGEVTSTVGSTADSDPYWVIQYDQALRQYVNTIGTTTVDKIGYEVQTQTGTATGDNLNESIVTATSTTGLSISNKEPKYVSLRGSNFKSISTESVVINYAKKLGYAKYVLGKASVNATANKASKDYAAGEIALDDSGYKVTVDAIKATGVGGAVGNADKLGTSIETADSVTPLDTSANPLVVLDTNPLATQSANVITFGGQIVNSVSASALAGAELTISSDPVVKMVGTRLVVAGYDAAGTSAAANSLIGWLAENRASLTQ
ncbi:MAG: S-layer protein [Candidatus Micrarchaeota archaeon]